MHIVVVGTNHRASPIDIRERLAFRPDQLPMAYAALRHEVGLSEALILSTCNRVEIYAGAPEYPGALDRLRAFLGAHSRLEAAELERRLYTHREPSSIEHLFAVASGLDSMVLGETEIVSQVKQAYELAKQHGTTGKTLNVLFQKALNVAKAVHAKTGLGQGAVSVGGVAIEFAQKVFGALAPYTVLLVGAGKIGELTLKHLTARGVSKIRILNRSLDRARQLAALYGGRAEALDQLDAQLIEADIAILSASAPEALVKRRGVEELMSLRRHRPLCLIDLGVPRNVEPSAGSLENVYLFDIDDLQALVGHHHAQRQQAVRESQQIVEHKVRHFLAWWEKETGACAPLSSELAAAP